MKPIALLISITFAALLALNLPVRPDESAAPADTASVDTTAADTALVAGEVGGVVDQCVVCHTKEDELPEDFHEEDIHLRRGLTCAGCHGGDPTSDDEDIAMSEEAGFLGAPDRDEIPEFCGRCHSHIEYMRHYQPRIPTDQVAQYYTSVHGTKLREGDPKVAECASCHTAHAIFSPSDARSSVYPLNVPATCNQCHGDAVYMRRYNIPTDQYEKYASSVHGVALLEKQDTGAPACNDCHGNHGAVPPEYNSVAQICGNCHVNNMEYFRASPMAEPWADQDLHDCEECHSNHDVKPASDDMVGVHDGAVCVDCHDEGDKGYIAAGAIHAHLDTLTTVYSSASALLTDVRSRGMDDVDITFALQESHQDLIRARTLVHTFDPKKVAEETHKGTKSAEEAIALSEATIRDFYVRRRGFGMATVFITLLIVALFFKIRQIDRAA